MRQLVTVSKSLLVFACISLICAICVSVSNDLIAEGRDELGGVDLKEYCQNHGYDGVYLGDKNDAYSWKCVRLIDIDVTDVCRQQYGNPDARANALKENNASSWRCYQGQKELGGVALKEYCQDCGYADVVLSKPKDASSWKCKQLSDISVTNVCREQYGNQNAFAKTLKRNNAFSWRCYINSSSSTENMSGGFIPNKE